MAKGRKTGGRKPGTPNKVTADMREAFRMLVEGEVDQLREALHEVRFGTVIEKQTDQGTVIGRLNADPKGYLDVIAKLSEFCIPKLGRTELAGDQGGPVVVEIRKFTQGE